MGLSSRKVVGLQFSVGHGVDEEKVADVCGVESESEFVIQLFRSSQASAGNWVWLGESEPGSENELVRLGRGEVAEIGTVEHHFTGRLEDPNGLDSAWDITYRSLASSGRLVLGLEQEEFSKRDFAGFLVVPGQDFEAGGAVEALSTGNLSPSLFMGVASEERFLVLVDFSPREIPRVDRSRRMMREFEGKVRVLKDLREMLQMLPARIGTVEAAFLASEGIALDLKRGNESSSS